MTYETLLDNEYQKYKSTESEAVRAAVIYNIIQVKLDQNTNDYYQPIYIDIKIFICLYVKSLENANYGYDNLDIEKVFTLLQRIGLGESTQLSIYFLRLLVSMNYEQHIEKARGFANKMKFNYYCSTGLVKNSLKIILLFSSTSLLRLLITIFILIALYTILLLPFHWNFLHVFIVKYDTYHSNFIINHLLNLFAGAFSVSKEFEVIPINWIGVIILAFGKFFFFLIVGNFLVQEVYRRVLNNI